MTTIKPVNCFFGLCLVALVQTAVAEKALRDDGREVRLHKDGTWEFVSDEVYATSDSGLRVKLKPDGSWVAASTVAAQAGNVSNKSEVSPQYNDLVSLQRIEIQKMKQQRSMGAKSAVYEERTLALLRFDALPPLDSLNGFSLVDSNGNMYPLLSLTPLANGRVLAQFQGAPDRWSRAKFLSLKLDKSLLETLADIELRSDFRDVDTQIVNEFGLP